MDLSASAAGDGNELKRGHDQMTGEADEKTVPIGPNGEVLDGAGGEAFADVADAVGGSPGANGADLDVDGAEVK